MMTFREATVEDIPGMQVVRNAVTENMLSDPAIVPDKDVEDYILRRGKGWVCEIENRVLGFSIISVVDHNVWALFVHPDFEKLGIGKQLHDLMMDWYFSKTHDPVWLGTAPGTRAESFYHKAGWTANGLHGSKEVKFEMTEDQWKNRI